MAKVTVTISADDPRLTMAGKPCKKGDEIGVDLPVAKLLLRQKLIDKIPAAGQPETEEAQVEAAEPALGKRSKSAAQS